MPHACPTTTLYWRHVPLPPRVNLHTGTIGTPFLVSPTSSLLPATRHGPVPAASSSPLTSTWGFHVADAAHRGVTMPSVCPTPFDISVSNAYPIPAPSSHWGFHVADATRRGVHTGTIGSPFLVSPTSSLLPAPSTSTPSTLPWPRPCCVLQPLNIHMGVPRSRCSTPWSYHAPCLPHPL